MTLENCNSLLYREEFQRGLDSGSKIYILRSVTRNLIEKTLERDGPMRSSRLVDRLVESSGLTHAAARKQISRVLPPIYRYPLPLFPKKESFLYRETDRNSERFFDGLVRDLRESGSIYGVALDGLMARGGVAQLASFKVVSGAPEAQEKQVPVEGVLQRLKEVGLVGLEDIGEQGQCVMLHPGIFGAQNVGRFRSRRLAENILLDGLHEWSRKLALASYNAIKIRDDFAAPKFSTFYFDLCGPSYLMPLMTGRADARKPGFLVADVFCDSILDVSHIQYFLRKVRMLKAMRNVVPFLPIILADSYTKEAFRAGRSAGVIMATTNNLFGSSVADALSSLIDTLDRAAAIASGNPERIASLLDDLNAIEGAAGNLRGALFELIVGFLVKEVEGNSIDIGETIYDPDSGKAAEIDVRRIKEKQECWFYECKGRQPSNRISELEVEKWIEKLNRIYRYHRREERFQGCQFGFELWTSGGFDDGAIDRLKAEKARRNKITISWREGSQVREYAKQAGRKSILDTLDQHYFRHPLSE